MFATDSPVAERAFFCTTGVKSTSTVSLLNEHRTCKTLHTRLPSLCWQIAIRPTAYCKHQAVRDLPHATLRSTREHWQ